MKAFLTGVGGMLLASMTVAALGQGTVSPEPTLATPPAVKGSVPTSLSPSGGINVPNTSGLKSYDDAQRFHAIHASVDGNVAGRVTFFDGAGIRRAAPHTRVTIIQKHQVITSVSADESGSFQIVGLRPGIYSVIGSSKTYGVGVWAVRVVPYAENASRGGGPNLGIPNVRFVGLNSFNAAQLLMDEILVPADDYSTGRPQIDSDVPPNNNGMTPTTTFTDPNAATNNAAGGGGGGGDAAALLAAAAAAAAGLGGGGSGGVGAGGGGSGSQQ